MSITFPAVYQRGALRPLKPLQLPERSHVRLQLLTDETEAIELPFARCLEGLRHLLASVEQNSSDNLVRQLFPQLIRTDLRTLWHLSRPAQRELVASLELAAGHLRPEDLTREQIAALRFTLGLLDQQPVN
jgi:predicted DNA-binding antitoxin AbrB/MazE fold protein